jgi:hypothetical protein
MIANAIQRCRIKFRIDESRIARKVYLLLNKRTCIQIINSFTYLLLATLIYIVLYSILSTDALPSTNECFNNYYNLTHSRTLHQQCQRQGTVFGVFIIVVVGITFGKLVKFVYLPSLFGNVLFVSVI